jgi:phosphatidylserine decarboxylase
MTSASRYIAKNGHTSIPRLATRRVPPPCIFCRHRGSGTRHFSASWRNQATDPGSRGPFRSRLRAALNSTKIKWSPIPIGLGITFLGAVQFYKVQAREREKIDEERRKDEEEEYKNTGRRPPRRKRIRPSGPWYVQGEPLHHIVDMG